MILIRCGEAPTSAVVATFNPHSFIVTREPTLSSVAHTPQPQTSPTTPWRTSRSLRRHGLQRTATIGLLSIGLVITSCGTASDLGATATQTVQTTVTEKVQTTTTLTTTTERTVTVVSTATVQPSAASQAVPSANTLPIGVKASSGGIDLTVNAIANIDSYETSYNTEFETVAPAPNARFIRVDALVSNNTKASIDLTCNLPVVAKLADSESREFDPVENLYMLPGNPACNDQLQPGFESSMTWVYEVPAAADVTVFAFRDTDFRGDLPTTPAWAFVSVPDDV